MFIHFNQSINQSETRLPSTVKTWQHLSGRTFCPRSGASKSCSMCLTNTNCSVHQIMIPLKDLFFFKGLPTTPKLFETCQSLRRIIILLQFYCVSSCHSTLQRTCESQWKQTQAQQTSELVSHYTLFRIQASYVNAIRGGKKSTAYSMQGVVFAT